MAVLICHSIYILRLLGEGHHLLFIASYFTRWGNLNWSSVFVLFRNCICRYPSMRKALSKNPNSCPSYFLTPRTVDYWIQATIEKHQKNCPICEFAAKFAFAVVMKGHFNTIGSKRSIASNESRKNDRYCVCSTSVDSLT